jgi:hypothetical protein
MHTTKGAEVVCFRALLRITVVAVPFLKAYEVS